jgi:pyruvate/2-oxoglutarate dehydrogenase complex dihydrolipoamide acyltransferase (E2) component
MPQFRLPDLGEGVAEAEIDRWLVEEGDEVAEDEPLVEVITDKATVEIPSPFAGAVTRILVAAGEVVPVGTPLVTIGEDASSPVQPEGGDGTGSEVKATPPVRRLARALGVDLGRLTGSGPEGRVLQADVEAAAELEPDTVGAEQVVKPESESERRVPLRGVRRAVAERMAEAHRLVPAVTHVEECDVTELDATRRLANERAPDGARLTYLPFIIKAAVMALKSHPALNATLDETRREIVFHDRYDIGVAVDTPEGLVVPVVHDADHKNLQAIAAEVDELAARARAGTIAADDLRGGTFTITSPGRFGGLLATPIVLHPQSSILGVHRATERPVVRDGQVVIRKIMNLSVSFDHRVLDGMTAAQFALEVTELLEHPAVLAMGAD